MLRVGAREPVPVDVRLVAATSIDLGQAVKAGKFLEGLQQYLHDGNLTLPPLRERIGDIQPLAEYFLGVHAQRLELPVPQIASDTQRALESYSWPGNIRELENVIHFALLVSPDEEIRPEHLNFSGGAAGSGGVAGPGGKTEVNEAALERLVRQPGVEAQLRALLQRLERERG